MGSGQSRAGEPSGPSQVYGGRPQAIQRWGLEVGAGPRENLFVSQVGGREGPLVLGPPPASHPIGISYSPDPGSLQWPHAPEASPGSPCDLPGKLDEVLSGGTVPRETVRA